MNHFSQQPNMSHISQCKPLGYKTPFQAMLADLGKDVKIRFA